MIGRLWLVLWFIPALVVAVAYPSALEIVLPRSLETGFDTFGRNLLLITLHASVLSSVCALGATLLAGTLGVACGAAIGLAPPRAREAATSTLELFLAFPSLLLALAWAAVRGPGWGTLLVSLAIGTVPSMTRLALIRTRELLKEEYLVAAESLGASRWRIMRRHLAPALFSFCSVKIPNLFAHALLAEATLSFIGVGAPIGRETWGSLLAQGKDYLIEAPWIAFGSGLPLVFTLLALQSLGQTLTRTHRVGV